MTNSVQYLDRSGGRVLSAALMVAFICIAGTTFMAYGVRAAAVGRCDQPEAQLTAPAASKTVKDKPVPGVVRAILHNPPASSALVGETIVHVGDTIDGIAVVKIERNAVEFSKDGAAWQQSVLEAPHAAWRNPTKNSSR